MNIQVRAIRESTDGERIHFEVFARERWLPGYISRSALLKLFGAKPGTLLEIFTEEENRIGHAAMVHASVNPTLDMIVLGSSDF